MAEQLMPTCDKLLPKGVDYMSQAQWETEGCLCVREPGHPGPCECEHTVGPHRGLSRG